MDEHTCNAYQQIIISDGVEIESGYHDLNDRDDNSTQSHDSKIGTCGKEVSTIVMQLKIPGT